MDERMAVFSLANLADGVALLPTCPGVYCLLNRFDGKRYVGCASRSVRARAAEHRGKLRQHRESNRGLQAAFDLHGEQAFVYLALELLEQQPRAALRVLRSRELWWCQQLFAHDPRYGYNDEAGGVRTPSSRLRERERKLLNARAPTYALLPGVALSDPIAASLLASWISSS